MLHVASVFHVKNREKQRLMEEIRYRGFSGETATSWTHPPQCFQPFEIKKKKNSEPSSWTNCFPPYVPHDFPFEGRPSVWNPAILFLMALSSKGCDAKEKYFADEKIYIALESFLFFIFLLFYAEQAGFWGFCWHDGINFLYFPVFSTFFLPYNSLIYWSNRSEVSQLSSPLSSVSADISTSDYSVSKISSFFSSAGNSLYRLLLDLCYPFQFFHSMTSFFWD